MAKVISDAELATSRYLVKLAEGNFELLAIRADTAQKAQMLKDLDALREHLRIIEARYAEQNTGRLN